MINEFPIGFGKICRIAQDLEHRILIPSNIRYVSIHQCLCLDMVSLLVEEPVTQLYFVFFICHWLIHELKVDGRGAWSSWHYCILELKQVDQLSHVRLVPPKDVLLVYTKILRLRRQVPEGIEQSAED